MISIINHSILPSPQIIIILLNLFFSQNQSCWISCQNQNRWISCQNQNRWIYYQSYNQLWWRQRFKVKSKVVFGWAWWRWGSWSRHTEIQILYPLIAKTNFQFKGGENSSLLSLRWSEESQWSLTQCILDPELLKNEGGEDENFSHDMQQVLKEEKCSENQF